MSGVRNELVNSIRRTPHRASIVQSASLNHATKHFRKQNEPYPTLKNDWDFEQNIHASTP
jgi:hypothetical protein